MSFIKSIFDGPKKSAPTPQPPPASTNVTDDSAEERKKKRLGRASLILTGPGGDLSPVSTATGRVLGN